jgi:carboxylesterase type B
VKITSEQLSGEGLIHQAILESGTEYNFWSINLPESNPENYIRQVAESLNCSLGLDDYQMMDCLRDIPWEQLRSASFDCTVRTYNHL